MKVGVNSPVRCVDVFSNRIELDDIVEFKGNGRKYYKPAWKLTLDLSGDFIVGRLFNYQDITAGLGGKCWEEGTRFKSTVTGKEIELYRPKSVENCKRALQIRTYKSK